MKKNFEYKTKYEREMEALEAAEDNLMLCGKNKTRGERLKKNREMLDQVKNRKKSGRSRVCRMYDEYEEEYNEYRRYAM